MRGGDSPRSAHAFQCSDAVARRSQRRYGTTAGSSRGLRSGPTAT